MGMPNIPPKIESQIEFDRDDILKIFVSNKEKNRENVNLYLKNEREYIELIRYIRKYLSQEEIKKLIDTLQEIKELIRAKERLDQEQMKYIYHLFKKKTKGYFNEVDSSFILYILLACITLFYKI